MNVNNRTVQFIHSVVRPSDNMCVRAHKFDGVRRRGHRTHTHLSNVRTWHAYITCTRTRADPKRNFKVTQKPFALVCLYARIFRVPRSLHRQHFGAAIALPRMPLVCVCVCILYTHTQAPCARVYARVWRKKNTNWR